jgi:serine/threonine-protein kinase PRP4
MKMLKKGVFTHKHFDNNYVFLYRQIDPISKQIFIKPLNVTITSQRELLNLLKQKSGNIEHKRLVQFKDFIEQCIILNPKNRITP